MDQVWKDEGVAKTERLTPRAMRAIAKVLSDPRRFEILRYIATKRCAACSDLRASFPISAATLSHHLKELEAANLITLEKRGKFVDVTFERDVWGAYLTELNKL